MFVLNETTYNHDAYLCSYPLGITDSERIATFLNYSVHTINTCKTRVKKRSRIDNDKFQRLIMEI